MSAHARSRVAVADDDEAVRDALAALIEAYGFNVDTFGSGADVLQAHTAEAFHCLVLDHHMPPVDGLDVLQTLRQRSDMTPVILITGRPESAVHAKARSLRATAIIYKPASHAELMVAVQKAVASGKR